MAPGAGRHGASPRFVPAFRVDRGAESPREVHATMLTPVFAGRRVVFGDEGGPGGGPRAREERPRSSWLPTRASSRGSRVAGGAVQLDPRHLVRVGHRKEIAAVHAPTRAQDRGLAGALWRSPGGVLRVPGRAGRAGPDPPLRRGPLGRKRESESHELRGRSARARGTSPQARLRHRTLHAGRRRRA